MRVSNWPSRIAAALLLGGSIAMLLPGAASGAPPSSEKPSNIDAIERQIQELQDEVKKLKRANAGVEDLVDDKIRQSKPVAGYKNGFFISNQAGDYKLTIGGYTQLDGRFFITGTPGRRDWLANLRADPRLTVHLKRRAHRDLDATATEVTDPATRRWVLEHAAAYWYREQRSVDDLVETAPMVEVRF